MLSIRKDIGRPYSIRASEIVIASRLHSIGAALKQNNMEWGRNGWTGGESRGTYVNQHQLLLVVHIVDSETALVDEVVQTGVHLH